VRQLFEALLLLSFLTACSAAQPPATRIITVMPHLPASLLSCEPAPDVPVASSQAVVAGYIVVLWQAGRDCRAHLAAIKSALQTQ